MTSQNKNSAFSAFSAVNITVPDVKKDYTLTWTAGFASNPVDNLPDHPDPNHPLSLVLAGDPDLDSDVMPDTAKPRIKAQITVDGKVFKNVTYSHSKRRLVAD